MAFTLTTLTLSHFRSHARAETAFDGRPVVLVGHNGAGKTNLLEAVSLLSPGRGLRRAAPEDLIGRPLSLGWKIEALLHRAATPHEIITEAAPGSPRSTRIDTKSVPQSALGRLGAMLWLTPAMDRLWLEGAEGRRRFLDRLVLGFIPDHAEAALDYDKAMRDRNRLLRDGVTDAAWYTALESRMGDAGARLSANRHAILSRLQDARDDASPFPQPDLHLMDDSPADPHDLSTALAQNRRQDMAAGRSLIGPHRADLRALWAERGLPAAQCSTGEQKALLISTVLAHARALMADTGHPPILLLDELAAHLDEGRRAALFDAVCALGVQAFMTGTEPALFSALGARAQHFNVALSDTGTTIEEVTP